MEYVQKKVEKGYLIMQFLDFSFRCLKIILKFVYYRLSSKFNPNTAIFFFITKVALFKVTVAFRPYDINLCSCSQVLHWILFRVKPVA